MRNLLRRRIQFGLAAACMVCWQPVQAQEDALPVEITLHPAAAPQPALRYQLLPDITERIPGNAAVYYGKVKSERTAFFANKEISDKIDRLDDAPIDAVRKERPQVLFERYFLDQAARCTICDWQLPVGRESYAYIMLPEAQEMRQFCRILSAQTRIELAMGNFDVALDIVESNMAMGRHVAAGPTVVNGLIGLVICERSLGDLREMIQLPGSPNMYWALTTLPEPLVDFRPGLEAETNMLPLTLPKLVDVDQPGMTPDEWRQRVVEVVGEVNKLLEQPDQPPVQVDVDEAVPRLVEAARQALIEGGREPATVEAMADAQVVLADWLERYRANAHDSFCAWQLEYPASVQQFDAIEARAKRDWEQKRDLMPLDKLMTGFRSSRRAHARLTRSICVLRVLEGLRMYAASHEGRLPDQLADVAVPLPNDPMTLKPFEYALAEGKATLRGPSMPGAPLQYEITMVADAAD